MGGRKEQRRRHGNIGRPLARGETPKTLLHGDIYAKGVPQAIDEERQNSVLDTVDKSSSSRAEKILTEAEEGHRERAGGVDRGGQETGLLTF